MEPEGPFSKPEAMEMIWPDKGVGPYRVRVWFANIGNRPSVVGVEMWGVEPIRRPWSDEDLPDSAIRAVDIRLPLGRFLDDIWVPLHRNLARAASELWDKDPGQEERSAAYEVALEGRRIGRPRLPDTFLREVADVYNDAIAAGNRAPARAVEHRLGNGRTAATARGWIYEARKRGFIEAPTRNQYRKADEETK